MPREAKIKALIWLSGALLMVVTLAYVIDPLAGPADEPSHAYYLDSNAGDDSNSGHSPTAAWRTIGKINSIALEPGDTVYFRRGQVWRETLEPSNGGAIGRPVTFAAYGNGAAPVITGSDVVKGWSSSNGAVYRAHSPNPNNVYVDGKPGWGFEARMLHAHRVVRALRLVRDRTDDRG
jgi:hypothetical protein